MELVRFCVVGFVAFAIDMGVFLALQELAGLKDAHYGVLLSTAVAFAVSLFVHYWMAVLWVFKNNSVNSGSDHVKAGFWFAVTNVLGLLIAEFGMWLGAVVIAINYIIVKLDVTGVVMCWNYCCQKFFVFYKRTYSA